MNNRRRSLNGIDVGNIVEGKRTRRSVNYYGPPMEPKKPAMTEQVEKVAEEPEKVGPSEVKRGRRSMFIPRRSAGPQLSESSSNADKEDPEMKEEPEKPTMTEQVEKVAEELEKAELSEVKRGRKSMFIRRRSAGLQLSESSSDEDEEEPKKPVMTEQVEEPEKAGPSEVKKNRRRTMLIPRRSAGLQFFESSSENKEKAEQVDPKIKKRVSFAVEHDLVQVGREQHGGQEDVPSLGNDSQTDGDISDDAKPAIPKKTGKVEKVELVLKRPSNVVHVEKAEEPEKAGPSEVKRGRKSMFIPRRPAGLQLSESSSDEDELGEQDISDVKRTIRDLVEEVDDPKKVTFGWLIDEIMKKHPELANKREIVRDYAVKELRAMLNTPK